MNFGIYVMQKNENILLPLFVEYYGNLFGYYSIHIFDNGSDDTMKPILLNAELKGCTVIYDYDSASDFENKGKIIGEYITKNIQRFNISLPLDCDEFIGIEISGEHIISKELFYKYFSLLKDGAHIVQKRYLNNPYFENTFYEPKKNRKIYVKNCPVDLTSVGYHHAEIPSGYNVYKGGGLFYYELHNRPFADLMEKTKEKMKARIDLQNIPKKYSGDGAHLHNYLLWLNEYDLIESIYNHEIYRSNVLESFFKNIGQKIPFYDDISNDGEILFGGDDALFKKLAYKAESYCEYGCGESTVWVSNKSNAQIISVDTSKKWVKNTIERISKTDTYKKITWIDCGEVADWGFPKSLDLKENFISYALEPWKTGQTYDLVMIDGRFRVLCFLVSLKSAMPGTKILFDDYVDRPEYHIIEKVVGRLKTCGRQCLFEVPQLSASQSHIIDNLINKYRFIRK